MKTTLSYRMTAAGALLACAMAALAASPEEIKQLGTTLTPWGAEKAGNKDGTIPAYEGGLTKPPAGFSPTSGKWPNPYASQKPLFSITAANASQYADRLSPGQQELLKRFPTYRMDVYKTERSYYLPKERVEAIAKNASNPECKTSADGVGLYGCWGATPFPIPKTGNEAMWNALALGSSTIEYASQAWLIDSSGAQVMLNQNEILWDNVFWDLKQEPYKGGGLYFRRMLQATLAPARDAGNKTLFWYPLNADKMETRLWTYSTGQRRTRLAPELSYDTPSASMAGALNYDEINLFSGRMDRYDFKLVGKKEQFVQYNSYDMWNNSPQKILGKSHVNPDIPRYELHRVWVVEATLKPGKRHVAPKRVFFLDEDSWQITEANSYDASGKLSRVALGAVAPNYYAGGVVANTASETYYDLSKGQVVVAGILHSQGYVRLVPRPSDSTMTAEGMTGSGIR